MIVYGTRASNLKKGQIINVDCPNCATNTSMIYNIFGKYAHIYWIPLFPVKKVTITECNSCKATYDYKYLPEGIKTKLDREKEKSGVKTPVWMFSGLILIVALVSFGFYSSNQTDKEEATYIKAPKKGDVYNFKSSDGFYSTMKVESVTKDSLHVYINEMEISKMTGIDDIDKAENYKELYSFSVEQIRKMYKDGEIYQINRK